MRGTQLVLLVLLLASCSEPGEEEGWWAGDSGWDRDRKKAGRLE